MEPTNQSNLTQRPGRTVQPKRDPIISGSSDCSISYGENNILYPKLQGPDEPQLVEPDLHGIEREGTYRAFPEGLDINGETGTISVDTSETGLKYFIVHTSTSGKTCRVTVLISGIDYESDIFEGEKTKLSPVFNLDRSIKAEGIFDQPKRLGRPDLKPARESGLAIDKKTGVIDLMQTIENLRLMNVGLQDGFSRLFNIVYRVKEVTSVIQFVVYYYSESRDKIPDELIKLVAFKQSLQNYEGFEVRAIQMMTTMAFSAAAASESSGKSRPPQAVVVH